MPAAGTIVFDSKLESCVIVFQDAPNSQKGGNYGFPKGGRKKGESIILAAKRELLEESGLDELKHQLNFLFKTMINEVNERGHVATQYLVAILPQTADEFDAADKFTFDPEEITWVRFLPIAAALALLKPARAKALQDALVAATATVDSLKSPAAPAVSVENVEGKSSSLCVTEKVEPIELGKPSRLNIKLISVYQAGEEVKMPTRAVDKADKTSKKKVPWVAKMKKLVRMQKQNDKLSDKLAVPCNCQLCLSIGLGFRPPLEVRLHQEVESKIDSVDAISHLGEPISTSMAATTPESITTDAAASGRLKWLSKTAVWLLRHQLQTAEFNLAASDQGYVALDTLLKTAPMTPREGEAPVTLDEIKLIVAADNKTRFKLIEVDGVWFIRANQGHSKPATQNTANKSKLSKSGKSTSTDDEKDDEVKDDFLCDEKMLTKITTPLPVCVHGTTRSAIKLIMESGGLSTMGRLHVHFASGLDTGTEGTVKSGMRKDCAVKIYLNMALAMADGIEFFLSDNGVILSRGVVNTTNDGVVNTGGFIPRKYFASIQTDRKKQQKSVLALVDDVNSAQK